MKWLCLTLTLFALGFATGCDRWNTESQEPSPEPSVSEPSSQAPMVAEQSGHVAEDETLSGDEVSKVPEQVDVDQPSEVDTSNSIDSLDWMEPIFEHYASPSAGDEQ